jgi:hypothetical protein
VPGSTKEVCCQCLRQVWLSPATRKTVEESNPEYKIVCLVCGEKRLRENPSVDAIPGFVSFHFTRCGKP